MSVGGEKLNAIDEILQAEGLSASEARRKLELFEQVDAALAATSDAGGAGEPPRRWFVPGRIEVLGKHTDYAGGRSLLCTAGRGFCVAAAPRADLTVRITDVARGLTAEVALDADLAPDATGWEIYAQAVASRVARNFPGNLRGAEIALGSDLPRASGLSSSSALVVSLFTAIAAVNMLERHPAYAANIQSPEDLGAYLGGVENGRGFRELDGEGGVGTFGGSEDHVAILCGKRGQLAQYVFDPARRERTIPLEEEWSFVIGASGIPADKSGDAREKYNRLPLAVKAILDLWNRSAKRSDASLYAAALAVPDAPDRIRNLVRVLPVPDFSPNFLTGRLDQFLEESFTLIPQVGDLFARGEVVLAGPLVDRSQELAERFLDNQIPETVTLVRSARQLGAAAASAFGGGFGGSVWALVRTEDAESFRKRWAERYAQEFPHPTQRSRFFTTRPGPAAVEL
ncbi:MAG TPA: galactokinase family protein [Thermoanaerobaculia bacterium]